MSNFSIICEKNISVFYERSNHAVATFIRDKIITLIACFLLSQTELCNRLAQSW